MSSLPLLCQYTSVSRSCHDWEQKITKLNSTVVVLVAFGCTFGAALVAFFVRSRLPAQHLEGDSKDLVKLVLGLVATITALVLGLLISSAHSAYDAQESELQQLGVHLYQIDRILAHFGPDAAKERRLLRDMVAADVARIWEMTVAPQRFNATDGTIGSRGVCLTALQASHRRPNYSASARAARCSCSPASDETRRLLVEQSSGARYRGRFSSFSCHGRACFSLALVCCRASMSTVVARPVRRGLCQWRARYFSFSR